MSFQHPKPWKLDTYGSRPDATIRTTLSLKDSLVKLRTNTICRQRGVFRTSTRLRTEEQVRAVAAPSSSRTVRGSHAQSSRFSKIPYLGTCSTSGLVLRSLKTLDSCRGCSKTVPCDGRRHVCTLLALGNQKTMEVYL